ncbi:MAG TPA: MATE family efflux transporter [Clostridiales bacterium]|nr:MATE family efflux transporter [Clostridiales bacterium]
MKNRVGQVNGITEGVIWKQLLLFFFPLLFGTFLQQLYNAVDAIVVGQYLGKEALSAVGGVTGTLINVFIGFFVGTSSGATVTISQYYGAGNKEGVSKAVHTAIALAIGAGVVIMVVGIFTAPVVFRWMGTPEDIMPYSITFIRIYFCGTIPNLVYNMGTGILRAVGDSKRPLYYLGVGVALNIVLDLLFVAVFHMGVAGAAVATVISQAASAVLICITLMKTKESYRLSIRKIRFHKKVLAKIIRIGLPAGLQSLMYTSSNVIIQSSINSFGTNTIAAWTAYGKIDGLFWMTMSSFGISITTFVGQNYGAGKYDRVHKGIRTCLIMTAAVAVGISLALYLAGPSVYILFTKDAQVIERGVEILHFMVPVFCTYVLIEIISGALRGMGNSFIPMIMTGLGICALRIVWIATMVPVWHDIRTLLFCYPLTWVITSILFIFYYRYSVKRDPGLQALKG